MVYDKELNPYDFQTLMTSPPVRTVENTSHDWSDLIRDCCKALGVEVLEQLRQPLSEKLSAAQEQAGQDPSGVKPIISQR